MDMRNAFPSKYLKAEDLPGPVTVTMDRVEVEEMKRSDGGTEPAYVLYFAGKEKGLVLNKTRSSTISTVYGWDTDAWRGRRIMIYPAMTTFNGKPTPTIGVSIPQGAQRQQAPARPAPAPPATSPASIDQAIDGGFGPDSPDAPESPLGEPTFKEDDIPF